MGRAHPAGRVERRLRRQHRIALGERSRREKQEHYERRNRRHVAAPHDRDGDDRSDGGEARYEKYLRAQLEGRRRQACDVPAVREAGGMHSAA